MDKCIMQKIILHIMCIDIVKMNGLCMYCISSQCQVAFQMFICSSRDYLCLNTISVNSLQTSSSPQNISWICNWFVEERKYAFFACVKRKVLTLLSELIKKTCLYTLHVSGLSLPFSLFPLCSGCESNLSSISTSAGVSFSPMHSAHRC